MKGKRSTNKRRKFFNEAVYYALNIGIPATLLLLALWIEIPYPALALVILSKWRVVAVRPRFWWVNIQANLVDLVVGLGVVGLMYLPNSSLEAQIVLAVLYAIWLVIIKPMSKQWQVALQAGISICIGTMALMAVSAEWYVSVVVALMFVIGYGTARHFLQSQKEKQLTLLSLVWGIIFAEFGWLAYYWTYAYSGLLTGKVPQITIMLILMSFVAQRTYMSWKLNKKIILADIAAPLVFAALLIIIMLLKFNSVVI